MSVTYGFYNSLNHDRRYDAIQMSSIFDGIIRDGIFMSIGTRFQVLADSEMMVTVGTGRAWFDHTWTLNDSLLPISIPQSEVILNRIDAIVIEVNAEPAVRANSIKVVKGTPSSKPARPTLTNTATVHQYPLAYISVGAGVTSIRQADITSMIGQGSTPYVTGILETINIESMVRQWEDQWQKFFEDQTDDMQDANEHWKYEWESWYKTYRGDMEQTGQDWKKQWEEWYKQFTESGTENFDQWRDETNATFEEWFRRIQELVEGDEKTDLPAEVEKLEERLKLLETFTDEVYNNHALWYKLYDNQVTVHHDYILDSAGDQITDYIDRQVETANITIEPLEDSEPILDSDGRVIDGRLIFEFK